MADELERQTVEEQVIDEMQPPREEDSDDHFLDCRHDLPSVDPFSTLRAHPGGEGPVHCLFCGRQWTKEQFSDFGLSEIPRDIQRDP